MRTPEVEAAMAWAVLAYNGDTIGEAAAELLRSLAIPDIDQFSDNTERQHDGALRTLAAEVERLEKENFTLQWEPAKLKTRVETAEALVAELEAELNKRTDAYMNEPHCCSGRECGCMGVTRFEQIVGEELGQRMATMREQNARLRAALEDVSLLAHCISKAGPLNTPDLETAWRKFDLISVKAAEALVDRKAALNSEEAST